MMRFELTTARLRIEWLFFSKSLPRNHFRLSQSLSQTSLSQSLSQLASCLLQTPSIQELL
jgi:hypothetical protein